MGSCSRASRENNLSFSQHTDARIWKNASIYWREKFLRWRIRRHRIWTFWEVLWNTSRWAWFVLFDMEGLYQIEWASQCLGSFEFEKLLYWIWTSLGTTNRKVRRNSNWTFFLCFSDCAPSPKRSNCKIGYQMRYFVWWITHYLCFQKVALFVRCLSCIF